MAKFIYSFGINLLGLSLGMANSCWFFTTALLVIVLPEFWPSSTCFNSEVVG